LRERRKARAEAAKQTIEPDNEPEPVEEDEAEQSKTA